MTTDEIINVVRDFDCKKLEIRNYLTTRTLRKIRGNKRPSVTSSLLELVFNYFAFSGKDYIGTKNIQFLISTLTDVDKQNWRCSTTIYIRTTVICYICKNDQIFSNVPTCKKIAFFVICHFFKTLPWVVI